MKQLAVIIPAYNEEKHISTVINLTKKITDNILIIDDGSTDKTYDIAKKLGATVIRHEKTRGKGEGLKTGFNYLKKQKGIKYIAIIDADLQFLPKEIAKVVKPLERGSKFVMGRRDWSKVPFRHSLGNFVWRTLFNILYGTELKDTNCGVIAVSKDIVDKLKIGGGYIIENMMLASAVKNGIKIEQVPVDVKYYKVHGFGRGARVVSGVFFFILFDGIKYRLFGIKK